MVEVVAEEIGPLKSFRVGKGDGFGDDVVWEYDVENADRLLRWFSFGNLEETSMYIIEHIINSTSYL